MATKIRLQRHGRSKRPYYYVVVADSRARRDGKFIDRIGDYNPLTVPATINIDFDKAFEWVMKGAEPTDTAKKILSYKGVLYKKHLARGVRKGAMTPEEMEAKMQEWLAIKAKSIETQVEKLDKAKASKKAEKLEAETKKKEAYAAKLEDNLNAANAEAVEAAEEVVEETHDAIQEEVVNEVSTEEVAENPAEEVAAEEVVAETPEEQIAVEETPEEPTA